MQPEANPALWMGYYSETVEGTYGGGFDCTGSPLCKLLCGGYTYVRV